MRCSSLQVRLLGGFSFLLVGLGTILLWQGQALLAAERVRQQESLVLHAAQGARILDYWAHEREQALSFVGRMASQAPPGEQERRVLSLARVVLPEARAIELRRSDGRRIAIRGRPASPLGWAQVALVFHERHAIVSSLVPPDFENLAVATLVKLRRGDEVIAAYFDADSLARPFMGLPVKHRTVAVLDGNGRYVYSSRSTGGIGSRAPPQVEQTSDGSPPTPPRDIEWVSRRQLTAMARSRSTGFEVVVGLPTSVAFGHLHAMMAKIWAALGLLAAMVVVLGLWVNRGIVTPVLTMIRTAREVAAGNLAARAGSAGEAEVGELSQALDAMTERLDVLLKNREFFWQRVPIAMLRLDEHKRLVECNPSGKKALERLAPCMLTGKCDLSAIAQLSWAIDDVLQKLEAWSGQIQIGQGADATFWDCVIYPIAAYSPLPIAISIHMLETTNQVKREQQLAGEVEHTTADLRARTEALSRAVQELQTLDRAKTEFLSIISHELRTPLNVITGYSGMLSDGAFGALEEGARAAVDQIQGAGERLLELVNDLLDIARLEAGALKLRSEAIDYEALVQDVLYEQVHRAENIGIVLSREVPEALPAAWADPHRAAQVLENLVSNAIKFSKPGDRIVVRVHVDGPEIVTEVTDTGQGIPEGAMPKLFSRFYQVDMSPTRLHGGTGLGLAIVKGLVEAMGGRVGCRSREGHGSTFWFTIPVSKAS